MPDRPEPELVDGVDDTHALFLAPVEIDLPKGEMPVAREGTMGGVPSYQADPPKPKAVERVGSRRGGKQKAAKR